MLSLISTPDENQELVDFLTKVLSDIEGDKPEHLCVSYIIDDRHDAVSYLSCSYKHLRRLADAIDDEASIRMIAENQERIQKFIDLDADSDVESDE